MELGKEVSRHDRIRQSMAISMQRRWLVKDCSLTASFMASANHQEAVKQFD